MTNSTQSLVDVSASGDWLWIPYSALVLVSIIVLGASFRKRHQNLLKKKQFDLDHQEVELDICRPRIGRFVANLGENRSTISQIMSVVAGDDQDYFTSHQAAKQYLYVEKNTRELVVDAVSEDINIKTNEHCCIAPEMMGSLEQTNNKHKCVIHGSIEMPSSNDIAISGTEYNLFSFSNSDYARLELAKNGVPPAVMGFIITPDDTSVTASSSTDVISGFDKVDMSTSNVENTVSLGSGRDDVSISSIIITDNVPLESDTTGIEPSSIAHTDAHILGSNCCDVPLSCTANTIISGSGRDDVSISSIEITDNVPLEYDTTGIEPSSIAHTEAHIFESNCSDVPLSCTSNIATLRTDKGDVWLSCVKNTDSIGSDRGNISQSVANTDTLWSKRSDIALPIMGNTDSFESQMDDVPPSIANQDTLGFDRDDVLHSSISNTESVSLGSEGDYIQPSCDENTTASGDVSPFCIVNIAIIRPEKVDENTETSGFVRDDVLPSINGNTKT